MKYRARSNGNVLESVPASLVGWLYDEIPEEVSEAPGLASSEPGTPAPPPDLLEGVVFASLFAERAARDAGLRASAFQGRTGSGSGGAFTKADVLRAIGDWA